VSDARSAEMKWTNVHSTFWRRAMQTGIRHLPEPWLRYSPPAFGLAFAAALAPQRNVVRETLRRILGKRPAPEELRDVAAVFANFASSMTEGMLVGSERGYHAINRPKGDWHFLSALAQRRGAIIATAQTAGWDVAGSSVRSDLSVEIWVVMEREKNAEARALHDAARERAGIRLLHVGDDPLASLPLLRHLRRGGVVALKIDRSAPGKRTRPVTFLGEPWQVPEGPLRLAALTGAPLIPAFTRRLGFLEYQTINSPPINLPRRPTEAQFDAAAQRLADELERFVRAHPTQWFRFR
jgi:lauroyl/myristoyl acyltransferase